MSEYIVEMTRSVTVFADDKEQARKKANKLFEENMDNREVTVDEL